MVGAVGAVPHVAVGIERSQVAALYLASSAVDDRGIPMAVFIGGLSQLAGYRELSVAGLRKGACLLQLLQVLAVDPKADKRRFVGIGEHVSTLIEDVAHQRAGARRA